MGSTTSAPPSYPGARAAQTRLSQQGGTPTVRSHRYNQPPPRVRHQTSQQRQNQQVLYRAQQQQQYQQYSNRRQTAFRPGAYSITPLPVGSPGSIHRIAVPFGAVPGRDFQVSIRDERRTVRIRCPAGVRPGQLLDVTLPPEPIVRDPVSIAPLTRIPTEESYYVDLDQSSSSSNASAAPKSASAPSAKPDIADDDDKFNSDGVILLPDLDPNGRKIYKVKIPIGFSGGQQFVVTIQDQKLAVICPPNVEAGDYVRVVPPIKASKRSSSRSITATDVDEADSDLESSQEQARLERQASRPQMTMEMFEVAVPAGTRSGQSFTLMAGGQRVLVTCPPNTLPGQRVRFQLPMPDHNQRSNNNAAVSKRRAIKMNYETKDGWTRTVRLPDYKFQWIRTTNEGKVKDQDRFDMEHSAYVRKLDFKRGNDERMRAGVLSLVPASKAAVASSVKSNDRIRRELVSYADISVAQRKPFKEKVTWFQDMCLLLKTEWSSGHMRIQVRRDYLLSDSLQAVMSMGREDLRKVWRFEFLGEEGIDAGGLAREWYQLVSEEIFNADRGLWSSSEGNQMCMDINPASQMNCGEDHIVYFRFLGRVMGKALFDKQLISGHMVRHLYKHILGWPLTFHDLEMIDEQYYSNMKKLKSYSEEELEMLCLVFTETERQLGVANEIELAQDGKNVDVTAKNLPEYMEACTKYRLMGRVKPQLTELLLGFFDIIPEPLLTVFDFQELELLMCGLPEIDMDDWKANTEYVGTVASRGRNHRVVKWFWEVVEEDFDQALKAKLLQFVTGTSGVPSRGFSVLHGNDGLIRKFNIQGVSLDTCLYPRAHTCFNRIDIPMYKSKEDLREKLKIAVQIEPTGFSIE